MKIENWNIDKLLENERKLRKNDNSVERMSKVIAEFGFRLPVLVQASGVIVDGDLRVKAARALGLRKIPVIVVDDLEEAKIRALRLVLNRSSTWAAWDEKELALEIADLNDLGLDLSLTGFESLELEKYLQLAGVPDEDADSAPPLEEVAVSRPGDLWHLGNHKLVCGDSSLAASCQALCGGGQMIDCIWTDPPYGVKYEGKKVRRKKIENDALNDDLLYKLLYGAFKNCVAALKNGGAFYVAHADMKRLIYWKALTDSGLKITQFLVWVKNHFVVSHGDYHNKHEPVFYGVKPGGAHAWHGDRKQQTVQEVFPAAIPGKDEAGRDCWQVIDGGHIYRITGTDVKIEELAGSVFYAPKPNASKLHPTMKPVALIEAMLKNSTLRGEWVLDPFAGSGSTLMACERLGRHCAAIELDPLYVDCIIRRWQEATGLSAIHANGAAFDDKAAA